jgi:hypothetical protein
MPDGSSTWERALLGDEQGYLNGTAICISLERGLLELGGTREIESSY